MIRRIRSRLSFANIISVMALSIALGGTSYAAIQLPKNSVKAKQIAKGAVGTSEAKNLRCRDFSKKQRRRACQKTKVRSTTVALQNPQCTTNPANLNDPAFTFCNYPAQPVTAACAAREHATGGGSEGTDESSGSDNGPFRVASTSGSRPEPKTGTPTSWTLVATGSTGAPGTAPPPAPTMTVYAVCSR